MKNRWLLMTGRVARYCEVSRASVLRWIKSGLLPAYTTPGGHYRTAREYLRRFLEEYGTSVEPSFFEGE